MATITATTAGVKPRARIVYRPVGSVEFASPHYQPEQSLGAFGKDPVRFIAVDRDRPDLPRPVGIRTTGDLQDYLDNHMLEARDPVKLGRADVYGRRWGAWFRLTLCAKEIVYG